MSLRFPRSVTPCALLLVAALGACGGGAGDASDLAVPRDMAYSPPDLDAPCVAFGSDCSLQMTCSNLILASGVGPLYCKTSGGVPVQSRCRNSFDCGADRVCLAPNATDPMCLPLCDDKHPCAMTFTCTPRGPVTGSKYDFSVCMPN